MITSLKFMRLGAMLLLLSLSTNARAGSIAVALTPEGAHTGNAGVGFSLGWEFTANSNMQVTQLGYFVDSALLETHDVGIYTAAGALVTSTTVVTTDPVTVNFAYHTLLSPVTLTAGQTYWIMGTSGFSDFYTFTPSAFSTDPAIAYLQSGYNVGNSLAFQTIQDNVTHAYFGPNFQFNAEDVAVPEPSTVIMAGTAALIFGVAAHRRRSRARAA
jgi:Domain of unknown function (DUF4082)